MRVSKKTDYALRALFTLVDHFGGAPIPIRELARRNDVPKRFLEQIMLDLKSQGWVDSVAESAAAMCSQKIRPKSRWARWCGILTALLAPIDCVSVTGYKRCSQEPVCRFRRVFLDARNYVAGVMDKATLAEVAKGAPVSKQRNFGRFYRRGRHLKIISKKLLTDFAICG